MATPFSEDAEDSAGRISPRHVFETRIRIRLQRSNQRLTLQGWARDLSESGLGAFVAEALVLGEFVTLELPLPDCDKEMIPAKVIRALGTEYGFQFTALSAEQRTRIRATVKAHPVIPYHGKRGLTRGHQSIRHQFSLTVHETNPLQLSPLSGLVALSPDPKRTA